MFSLSLNKALTFIACLLGPSLVVLVPGDADPLPGPQQQTGQKVEAGPTAPPLLEGKAEVEYLAEVNVRNVPQKYGVVWDVTPEDKGVQLRVIKVEKAVVFSGPPGKYTVKCRLVKVGADGDTDITELRHAVTIKGGVTPPNPVDPPGPVPPNPVDPTPPVPPQPQPTGKVAKFVVVEDTTKAGAWRGDIIGSNRLQAYYRQAGLKHRIVDVGAGAPGVPADLKDLVDQTAGKPLPWLFVLDKDNKVLKSEKAPLTPPEFIVALGGTADEPRAMGNLDAPRKLRFKKFGEHPNVPLIPRDQWKVVDLSVFLPPVKDQDGIGACNAFATCSAVEACRALAGLEYVRLSCGYLYGKINGGRDQGSYLEDGLAWMTEHGTVPTSVIGDLEWKKGRAFNGAKESEPYRVLEAYECPSFDAMASALQQGFFVVEGLAWFNNFTPDRDGWLPSAGRGGEGGHALCGYGLAQRNGVWGIRTRNSWGTSWGIGGNCVIPESLFNRSVGGYWCVRSVVQTPVNNWSTTRPEPKTFPTLDFALAP